MAYEGTEIAVSKSQEGIRKLLLENGATGIAFVSQSDPLSEGFEAMIPINGNTYRIRIVATVKKMERPRRRNSRLEHELQEVEMRRIWRVLFYHLKSAYEASNSGVMEFREMMLPYVILNREQQKEMERILQKLDS